MLGAIAGDMIGVPWEALGEKRYDLPLFTEFLRFSDDTVMTLRPLTHMVFARFQLSLC